MGQTRALFSVEISNFRGDFSESMCSPQRQDSTIEFNNMSESAKLEVDAEESKPEVKTAEDNEVSNVCIVGKIALCSMNCA